MGSCFSSNRSKFKKELTFLVNRHLKFFEHEAEFLNKLDGNTEWIPLAVTHYEEYLEARAKENRFFPPPIDVAWIWHLHLLHPVNYNDYCTKKFSKVITPLNGELTSKNPAFNSSKKKPTKSSIKLPKNSDNVEATWEELHEKQLGFYRKVANFKPTQNQIKRMVIHYLRFLHLMSTNEGVLVPTIEIDIVWHSNLHHPELYEKACKAIVGKLVNHNDLIEEKKLSNRYQETTKLYQNHYPGSYGIFIWSTTPNNNDDFCPCPEEVCDGNCGSCGGGGADCGGNCDYGGGHHCGGDGGHHHSCGGHHHSCGGHHHSCGGDTGASNCGSNCGSSCGGGGGD